MGFKQGAGSALFNVILSDRFVGLFGLGHEGLAALAPAVLSHQIEIERHQVGRCLPGSGDLPPGRRWPASWCGCRPGSGADPHSGVLQLVRQHLHHSRDGKLGDGVGAPAGAPRGPTLEEV